MTRLNRSTIEGTWDEIARLGETFAGRRFRITVLPEDAAEASTQIIAGMFPEFKLLTDDDLKITEFHGDPDDGLDWSQ